MSYLKLFLGLISAGFLTVASAQASTVCTNDSSQDPDPFFNVLFVTFNADTGGCVMSTNSFFPPFNGIIFSVNSGTSSFPDLYGATVQENNSNFLRPDSLTVNSVAGNEWLDSYLAVFGNLSGDVSASVLATVLGQTYRMDIQMVADGGTTVRGISATVSAVPVPAALPLLASGLGALGVIGWRRKKRVNATA